MNIRITLIILSALLTNIAFSQPALAWDQHYNGPPDYGDEAHDIVVDNAGNAYVTGSAFAANGTLDMVTIKYSAAGQQLWLQSYNGSANDNDEAFQIVLGDSGFVYVVGYSKGSSSMQDITTIKYSAAGVQMWAATYDGAFSNYDAGNALTVDAAGNVYVTGVETTSNYTYDFVTIKYSPGGTQMWAQTYDGPGNFNDEPKDIALDANNNIYVTGASDTFYNAQPNADIVLLKYNNSGSLQWRRVYDSPGHGYEYSRKLAIDNNGNIAVAGFGFITGNGQDFFTLKYNSAGVFQWMQTYNSGPNLFDVPYDMAIDSLGGIIITGQGIQANNNNANDYLTVKYNAGGTFQWAMRYNGPVDNDDRAYGICLDDSLNIVVTGFSKGSGTGFDIATVKYDPAGNEKWAVRYNSSANQDDAGNAVASGPGGDVYVCGKSANLSNDDYVTLRYSYSAVGIAEQDVVVPTLDLYPNPSNGDVKIVLPSVAGNGISEYSVSAVNALGQPVSIGQPSLTESTGNKDVMLLNTGSLASGMYSVIIRRGGQVVGTARFIVE